MTARCMVFLDFDDTPEYYLSQSHTRELFRVRTINKKTRVAETETFYPTYEVAKNAFDALTNAVKPFTLTSPTRRTE